MRTPSCDRARRTSCAFAYAAPIEGPNYDGTAARFEVTRDGEHVTTLSAEKRNWAGVCAGCRARSAPWAAFMHLPAAYLGQHLAHIGFAVTIIGVTLVSLDTVDVHSRAAPGDSVTAGDYVFTFAAATPIEGPNYDGTAARFEVTRDGEHVTTLSAEKRNSTCRSGPIR
ncbi:cytochrome c-type biogenesis CcmF C-terminal domain-containing protein [Mycobacterium tuberculosis]|uniref:cytochrome c-type biogenesis CcmF C-terminal domain-containing protein n=1 Tax=Mycobacterium tuberculosis TaxID=1773 RepID=UPI002729CFA0|nr:cytochrome c-type biogenesis CcmF C-terminal domain-containing protein [Mycobacterium tuberculosis]